MKEIKMYPLQERILRSKTPRVIWAVDFEGYPLFPKDEIWFMNPKYMQLIDKKTGEIYKANKEEHLEGLHPASIWCDEFTNDGQKLLDKACIEYLIKKHGLEKSGVYGEWIKKEACMKKAVFILQETTKDGIEGYIVKGWEGILKDKELPKEYFNGFPFFCLFDEGDIKVGDYFTYYIMKNNFIKKEIWNTLYQSMLQAGHRLSRILEEQRKPKEIRVEI